MKNKLANQLKLFFKFSTLNVDLSYDLVYVEKIRRIILILKYVLLTLKRGLRARSS